MIKNSGTEKKRKRFSFTAAEKVRLADKVKDHPCIWDFSHPKRFNINNVSSAWDEISVAMEKSVEECKDNWAALRDSKRYRMKSALKRKCGDSGGLPILKESFDADWEFGKAMEFLPDNSKKIKTLDSSGSDGAMDDAFAQETSKYIYNENFEHPGSILQNCAPVVDDLHVENLNALIEFQLQRNNNKRVRSKERGKVLPLKYQTLYAHMDTMLSRLPQEKVDRVSNKILSFITEELYKN